MKFSVEAEWKHNLDLKEDEDEEEKDSYDLDMLRAHIHFVHQVTSDKLDFTEGKIIEQEYFLIETKHSIHLATFEWFTEDECNRKNLMILNTFSRISGRWMKELKDHQKFKNFHGCNMVMVISKPKGAKGDGNLGKLYIILTDEASFIISFHRNHRSCPF
jgi:hypothetical protein